MNSIGVSQPCAMWGLMVVALVGAGDGIIDDPLSSNVWRPLGRSCAMPAYG
jgi:hypothetical protein